MSKEREEYKFIATIKDLKKLIESKIPGNNNIVCTKEA